MPNFSGVWNLKEQIQALAAGRWTWIPTFELYAWGSGTTGRLGDGTVVSKSSPIQIGSLVTWYDVAASRSANDAASLALKTDGTLWGWGYNGAGAVGDGTTANRSSPVQVGLLSDWASVAVWNHSAAVKTNNTLWSWGNGYGGKLGHNNTVSLSSPVQVGALTNWSQVSTGLRNTACVKTDNTIWVWGGNSQGSVGDGTVVYRSSPVQIGLLTNWASVSAGGTHTLAVKTTGTMWAWGNNQVGQLGNGQQGPDKSSPVQIGALTTWLTPSTGEDFCLALKTDGTLWGWGDNGQGQIGNSTVDSKSSPIQIGALTNWSQVSAGDNHTAALKTDGTLWAWGDNSPSGNLGDDTVVDKSSPVQIGSSTGWDKVSAGGGHTLAILQGSSN